MAPEQILGTRRDPRSDIFALGVLIYFLSTGKRPFGESQTLKGMKRRLWREPTPPRAIRSDYPSELQEVVLHCLEVNPAERYPTAAQVGFELRNLNQVKLTGRAAKVEAASFWSSLKRKFNQNSIEVVRRNSMATQIAAAPIVMIAIDLNDGSLDLADVLQWQHAYHCGRSNGRS